MTRTRRNSKSLLEVLNSGNYPMLVYGANLNYFLVDTGVFIDLDVEHYGNGKSGATPAKLLEKFHRNYPLLVTGGVMQEIKNHREDRRIKISGRDEISHDTATLSYGLYSVTLELFRNLSLTKCVDEMNDFHRLSVRFAYEDAFLGDSRKGIKDRMSYTDMELITVAFNLSKYHQINDIPCTVNILSADSHLLKTIKRLKSPLANDDSLALTSVSFKDYNVRAINTRGNLGSYMNHV